MTRRNRSLRGRLMWVLLLSISLLWLLVGYRVYTDAWEEVEEIYDATLAQHAKLLVDLLAHEAKEDEAMLISQFRFRHAPSHPYEFKIAARARFPDGHLVLITPGAPPFPDEQLVGFHTIDSGGARWRVFIIYEPLTRIRVMTGQLQEVREELVGLLVQRSMFALAVGLPLFGLLIWWGIGRGLRPLRRLTRQVGGMGPHSLELLDDRAAPCEVHPLVVALNNLFIRVRRTQQRERSFTADAAHELRTPLSAIKTQAQVARRAQNREQLDRALEQICTGVDRTTHLVNQLLQLARIDSGQLNDRQTGCDLHRVATEVIVELAGLALEKRIELSLASQLIPCPVAGQASLLSVLLRNLVDNAIRYACPEGNVSVVIEPLDAQRIELRVEDDGPGIPAEQVHDMFERFRRGNDGDQPGSGLGLSIVKRICEVLDTQVILSPGAQGGGLVVRIELDRIPNPAADGDRAAD